MLKEMVLKSDRQWRKVLYAAGAAVISALLSYSTAGSWAASANCAAAAAVSPLCSSAVLIGSLVSYLVSGMILKKGMIICSLVIIAAGKWILNNSDSAKNSAFIAALSMTFSSVMFGIILEHSAVNCVLYLISSAIMSTAAYIISKTLGNIEEGKPLECNVNVVAAIAVVYLLIIAALSGLSVSVINLGRIVAAFFVMTASRRFRYVGGSVCGILSMTALFVCSRELGVPAAFLGIAGFAAGFASNYHRVVTSVIFLAVNFCGQLILGMDDAGFNMQADSVIGCIIFMVVPERIFMSGNILPLRMYEPGGEKLVSTRMEFTAGALVEMRRNVEEIVKTMEKKSTPYSLVNTVSGRVCGKCRNKLYCWDNNFERTNEDFIKISRQNNLNIDNFPSGLSECIHKKDVAEGFERCRREEALNKMMAVRLNEKRNILFSHMEITENIILSMSDRINFSYSKNMTRDLCSCLEKYDLDFNTAIAYYNKFGKLIIEIYTNDYKENDSEEIADLISYDLNMSLEVSDVFCSGKETRIRLSQTPKYEIEYCSSQCSAAENEPTGDNCGFFYDGLGCAYIFVSDGMGTGKQAALDSAIVSGLFKRLIRSGIECGPAVKMINSIMLTKSGEESFATLDVCRIDLETGELTLFKSGASSTIIRYSDAVMMFNAPSSPIGIIPEMQVYTQKCNFEEGNIAVMLSDGVDESMYLYIKEQLLNNPDLEKITENVCAGAKRKRADIFRDDITVSAVRLREHSEAKNMNFA